jgi:ABC-type dipeptide/oligopeptide/nickel transport system permease subunit
MLIIQSAERRLPGDGAAGSRRAGRWAPWLVYPPGVQIFPAVRPVVLVAAELRDASGPRAR